MTSPTLKANCPACLQPIHFCLTQLGIMAWCFNYSRCPSEAAKAGMTGDNEAEAYEALCKAVKDES